MVGCFKSSHTTTTICIFWTVCVWQVVMWMRSSRQFQISLFFWVFLRENFTHTKSTKSIKRTKKQTSQQATFLPLDVFYVHKNAVSLFLFAFIHFVLFVRSKSFCKKIILYYYPNITLIASFTLLMKSTPKNFLSVYSVLFV